MILLDTSALLWLETGNARARPLSRSSSRLFLSPASLLELQLLIELGRVKLRGVSSVNELGDDDRWTVDDPSGQAWFEASLGLSWTRDPFDRLIVAHALSRGWRLATSDRNILEHLEPKHLLEL